MAAAAMDALYGRAAGPTTCMRSPGTLRDKPAAIARATIPLPTIRNMARSSQQLDDAQRWVGFRALDLVSHLAQHLGDISVAFTG
ncbi:hypothetical protein KNHN1_37920 [Pseudomonas guariconensis]